MVEVHIMSPLVVYSELIAHFLPAQATPESTSAPATMAREASKAHALSFLMLRSKML